MMHKKINIINKEPFTAEDGLSYMKVTKEILTPRKTYLKGVINGKYRGNRIPDDYDKSDLFDFEIYEAEIVCTSIGDFSKNKPFVFPNDFKNVDTEKKIKGRVFPKNKLPEVLPVKITANDKTFGINVLEPKLFEFEVVRKYHQTEGDQVFGMFNAYATGYVIDFEREETEEIIGPITEDVFSEPEPVQDCFTTDVETGKTEVNGRYIRKEFKCQSHDHTIWGKWEYYGERKTASAGCFFEIIAGFGILLFLGFLLAVLPGLFYFIGFYIIILLIGLLAPYLKWVFRGIGIILIVAFFGSLIKVFTMDSRKYNPQTTAYDTQKETAVRRQPIKKESVRDENSENEKDYYITKYREWKDYDGNHYQGYYKLKLSDVNKASIYKRNLSITQSTVNAYDKIVYNLKEYDKDKLHGLYHLFDSIQTENKLTRIKFAEMTVSFVQDIPYVLILEEDCNSNLYGDSFVRKYLNSPNAKCSGFQRFGINTPVEFLYNLNGDCDTRTLLLYTILSHYDYDVALMSSEFYGHSVLGINLPLNGLTYTYANHTYVLWETTNSDVKPGIISNQISNLNNWRISLKSK